MNDNKKMAHEWFFAFIKKSCLQSILSVFANKIKEVLFLKLPDQIFCVSLRFGIKKIKSLLGPQLLIGRSIDRKPTVLLSEILNKSARMQLSLDFIHF